MAASHGERRSLVREWIAEMEQNYRRRCQLDDEADQRASNNGIIDESPINAAGRYARSGTNRTSEK